jgi:hypothetical protein
MLEAGMTSLVRDLASRPVGAEPKKSDFSLSAGSKAEAANQNERGDPQIDGAASGGLLVAQAMPMPLANPAGAAWAAKFTEAAFPLLSGAAPAVGGLAKLGIVGLLGALVSSGGEVLLGRLMGHIPSNVSTRELQMASIAMHHMGLSSGDMAHLSDEQKAFFVKTSAVAVNEMQAGNISRPDYLAALGVLLEQAGQLNGLPTAPVAAPPSRPGVLVDDVTSDEANLAATTFNAQNARGGQIAIPVPRSDRAFTVITGAPDQLAAAVDAMKRAGILNRDFDLREAAASVGLNRPSLIVVPEGGGGGFAAPEGLTPAEQRQLGLAGRGAPDVRAPARPRNEGFPEGMQPDPRDGIFENPRGSGPSVPSHTGNTGGNDNDLRMDRTTIPQGGETVRLPVPVDGDSSLTTAPQSIAQVTGRLVVVDGKEPLTDTDRGELMALALGAKPDNPDSGRNLAEALDKIGLGETKEDIPAARRAVQQRLGVESADDLVVELTGSVTLPGLLRHYPEVGDAILTRPKTIEALGQHPKALLELQDILRDLGRQDPLSIRVPSLPGIPRSNLTAGQVAISQAASAAVPQEDFLRNQPGFDPAWRSDPEMISQYLNGLYASAEAAMPEFSELVNRVADATSGTAVLREEPKSRKRAMDKIEKYGDPSRLTDLVAGRLFYDRISDIYNAVAQITADPNVQIVDFEDRILNPQPSGYRDVTMKIQMANGHVAELQIGLTSIGDYAKDVEHALYEVYRDLAANAKRTGTGITDSARFIMNSIRNRTIPEYNRLFERANTNDTYGPELPGNR